MAPVCDVSRLLLLLLLWLLLQGIETFVLQDYGLISLGLGPIQFKLGQVSYFGIGRPEIQHFVKKSFAGAAGGDW